MSTRSVIAVPQGDGWRGRYCHGDGYPRHLLVALREIVKRDGVEPALKVLTEDHFGWSQLRPQQPRSKEDNLGDRSRPVVGYGVAYTEEQDISEDDWIRSDGGDDDWNTEWAYVVYPRSIAVLANKGDGDWELVGSVRHEDEVSDTDLRVLECGENYERCPHLAWVHFPEAKDSNYGTREWLSIDVEPRLGDASAVLLNGIRFPLQGSGGIVFADGSPAWGRGVVPGKRPVYWASSVRDADGGPGGDIIVGRQTKGGLKLTHPIVLPPNGVRGEVLVEAGTVIAQ